MNIKHKKYQNAAQRGFTLVELMIATTVFAVIMLIVTVAVLYVSNTFIKGDNEAQTQDIARSILTTITQDIEFNKASSVIIPASNGATGYYCVGNHVYVYQLGQEIPSAQEHALLVFTQNCPSAASGLNTDPGGTTTTYAQDLNANNLPSGLALELLASNMRLGQLSIVNVGGNVFQVSVTVAYGADDLLSGSGANYACQSGYIGGQFCAVSTLTTTITSRIQ